MSSIVLPVFFLDDLKHYAKDAGKSQEAIDETVKYLEEKIPIMESTLKDSEGTNRYELNKSAIEQAKRFIKLYKK